MPVSTNIYPTLVVRKLIFGYKTEGNFVLSFRFVSSWSYLVPSLLRRDFIARFLYIEEYRRGIKMNWRDRDRDGAAENVVRALASLVSERDPQ